MQIIHGQWRVKKKNSSTQWSIVEGNRSNVSSSSFLNERRRIIPSPNSCITGAGKKKKKWGLCSRYRVVFYFSPFIVIIVSNKKKTSRNPGKIVHVKLYENLEQNNKKVLYGVVLKGSKKWSLIRADHNSSSLWWQYEGSNMQRGSWQRWDRSFCWFLKQILVQGYYWHVCKGDV